MVQVTGHGADRRYSSTNAPETFDSNLKGTFSNSNI
jgi:hypothetical protein